MMLTRPNCLYLQLKRIADSAVFDGIADNLTDQKIQTVSVGIYGKIRNLYGNLRLLFFHFCIKILHQKKTGFVHAPETGP